MKFGIMVTNAVHPAVTPASQADYVTRLSVTAEEAGFDSIWVADRTVFPVDISARYPEICGPHHSEPESQKLLESMTTLSFMAGIMALPVVDHNGRLAGLVPLHDLLRSGVV